MEVTIPAQITTPPSHSLDVTMIPPDLFCGTLTERILAALVEEHIIVQSNTEEAKNNKEENAVSEDESLIPARTREEVMSLEERIRQEVIYLGLLDADAEEPEMEPMKIMPVQPEDEIVLEMRKCQAELRTITERNRKRRGILLDQAVKRMAYQEYRKIMDEIDRQIEGHFAKRHVSEPRFYRLWI